jgi:hypothetical protein
MKISKIKIILGLGVMFYILVGLTLLNGAYSDICPLLQDILELESYLRYIKSNPDVLNITNSYSLNTLTDSLSVDYIKTNYGFTTSDSEMLVKYFVSNKIIPMANIPLFI